MDDVVACAVLMDAAESLEIAGQEENPRHDAHVFFASRAFKGKEEDEKLFVYAPADMEKGGPGIDRCGYGEEEEEVEEDEETFLGKESQI